jgi:hypothetical protein
VTNRTDSTVFSSTSALDLKHTLGQGTMMMKTKEKITRWKMRIMMVMRMIDHDNDDDDYDDDNDNNDDFRQQYTTLTMT